MNRDAPGLAEGFRALPGSSGFIDSHGPLYLRRERRDGVDRVGQIGFRVESGIFRLGQPFSGPVDPIG